MSMRVTAWETEEGHKNPAVHRALIADGPGCVVRWTFIYFTTSWIDSEHLQRAGPAPAKLMCVYTLGRLGEKPLTRGMRPRGPGANHKHFSCLKSHKKKKKRERESQEIETNPSVLHMVPITQMLSHYWKYFSIFFWKKKKGGTGPSEVWTAAVAQPPSSALWRGCQW